jgi:hypothetical protein
MSLRKAASFPAGPALWLLLTLAAPAASTGAREATLREESNEVLGRLEVPAAALVAFLRTLSGSVPVHYGPPAAAVR